MFLSLHQGYMVELTTHQGSVGRVLRAGAALLGEGNLSEEEDSEVREQMNLLNSRWEHLRVASMERQSRYIKPFFSSDCNSNFRESIATRLTRKPEQLLCLQMFVEES